MAAAQAHTLSVGDRLSRDEPPVGRFTSDNASGWRQRKGVTTIGTLTAGGAHPGARKAGTGRAASPPDEHAGETSAPAHLKTSTGHGRVGVMPNTASDQA
ncbi:hypothetical protein GCM10010515_41370 [Streptomyces fructofermentans]|uniref:Uncharacterized protein n=1 Tax=Streptomyces fructofermentans TaxID=152141 RepID=A0A918KN67_9ACTN|nr:hypothetical protein GCM10010515_41370 [Streptomyces fructofermentans]